MAVVRLSWTIPAADLAARIADGYDQQVVERDAVGGPGPWVEISRATTRPPMVENVETYVYADPAGDLTYDYQVVYRRSSDGALYGTPLAVGTVAADGYCTLAEVRDEGVTALDATDAQVLRAIVWADRYIEKYTRRWFGPRFVPVLRKGGRTDEEVVFFDVPIIALLTCTVDGTQLANGDLEVYNRHLTTGQADDRNASRLEISDDATWGWFSQGRQNVEIAGIFGYTELPAGALPGETAAGSQVPLDYGEVPPLINWAARALTISRCFPMYSAAAGGAAAAAKVKRMKTRDQEIEYTAPSGAAQFGSFASYGEIHEVLAGYRRGLALGAV